MKTAPSAAPRTSSRGWQSALLAVAVCGLGLAHQRATATGAFREGGFWDRATATVGQWRQRVAARRAIVLERQSLERPTLVRGQAPFQRFDRWQMPSHCDEYPQWENHYPQWEVVWDDQCGPPRQCGHWYPADAPQHCGPWDHGW